MKPNSSEPHRLTGQTFEASGKAWTVGEPDTNPDRPGRMWVQRSGEDQRQSWPVEIVESYVLRTAAARNTGEVSNG